MGTFSAKAADIERQWYIVDAAGKTLGRMATEIARRLRGKHKAIYTPSVDTGDYIIVINADKVHVTGKKLEEKTYFRNKVGRPGGLKSTTLDKLLSHRPIEVIELAVKGMLPRGPLGRKMYSKLKVYPGDNHPHAAQNPQTLEIE